jgi:hypothetical protein
MLLAVILSFISASSLILMCPPVSIIKKILTFKILGPLRLDTAQDLRRPKSGPAL